MQPHSSPGPQRHTHHLVRAQSSARHPSALRRDKPYPTSTVGMGKTQDWHKGRVQGARQAGRGSAAGSSQGTANEGDLCIHGHLSTFGSLCVWTVNTQHQELLPELFSLSQSSSHCYWSTWRGNLPLTSEDYRSDPSNAFISRWRGSEIRK